MTKPDMPNPPKVTLEALLQWKKNERPSADFWQNFETELRQKQLAALVRKPRWWQVGMPRISLRQCGTVFGTLALAYGSFVSYRQFSTTVPVSAPSRQSVAHAPVGASPVVTRSEPSIAVGETAPSRISADDAVVSTDSAPVSAVDLSKGNATPTVAPGELVAMLPWVNAKTRSFESVATLESASPSSRSIAANLALAAKDDPELVNNIGMGSSGMVSAAKRSPLQADVLPTANAAFQDSRRARLAAYRETSPDAFDPEPAPSEHVRARTTRYLADGAWERDFSRVSAEGSRLSLKF